MTVRAGAGGIDGTLGLAARSWACIEPVGRSQTLSNEAQSPALEAVEFCSQEHLDEAMRGIRSVVSRRRARAIDDANPRRYLVTLQCQATEDRPRETDRS